MLRPSSHSDVDDAIDRVAADVTRGEPSSDFRARVMARIETRRPSYPTWIFAAAAAAIVMAVVIAHPWSRQATPIKATVAVMTPANEPVAPSSLPAPSTNEPVIARSQMRSAAPAPTFAQVLALPPIDPIEPITRDSIQPTKLSIPQLTLEPLVMPAVDDDGSIRDRR